jgi:hypothetical protein
MAFDAYTEPTADLIKAAIQSSMVLDADVGWRPFAKRGFTFGVGWSLVALGGDASTAEIITGVTGIEASDASDGGGPLGRRSPLEGYEYDITATVHLIRPELGWQFGFGERWLLDVDLGGAFTVGSKVQVTPDFEPIAPELQEVFTSETAIWLEDTIEQYVHSPTLSVGFGMRFGGG